MRDQIETVIREVLTPLFAADGGTMELVSVKDGVVQVRFGGSYRGCPSVSYTVTGYVLPAFRQAVGGDVRVDVLP
ncbi:MAG TPA: NifU family protein [Polyangiales bacterium]|nr:NifU family protein [Polyangiales bacterium]